MVLISSYGVRSPIADKAQSFISSPRTQKVLVIPFAGFDNDRTAAREINDGLIPFGFQVENIYVCSSKDKMEFCNIEFDWIYVPGGDPFKLLYEVSSCDLISWIKEKVISSKTSYWGVSAGADFLAEDLSYLKLVEDNNYELKNYYGLGIIKENILCHCDQRDYGTIARVKEYSNNKRLIMLNNTDIISIDNYKKEGNK